MEGKAVKIFLANFIGGSMSKTDKCWGTGCKSTGFHIEYLDNDEAELRCFGGGKSEIHKKRIKFI